MFLVLHNLNMICWDNGYLYTQFFLPSSLASSLAIHTHNFLMHYWMYIHTLIILVNHIISTWYAGVMVIRTHSFSYIIPSYLLRVYTFHIGYLIHKILCFTDILDTCFWAILLVIHAQSFIFSTSFFDNIFILKALLELNKSKKKLLYLLFVDHQAGFGII